MEQRYHICNISTTVSETIDWDPSIGLEDFIFKIVRTFELTEDQSFVLIDGDNDMVVLSPSIQPGYYRMKITNNVGALRSIVQSHASVGNGFTTTSQSVLQSHTLAPSTNENESFEANLIRVACADALIANERTWLAWTRTSLNIMTSCFTFVFLYDWSQESLLKRILCNITVVAFAMCFAGCFVVGYFRYRNLSALLRDRTASSRFMDLNVDPYHMHAIWAHFLGFLLFFAAAVFIIVLQNEQDSNVSVD